MLIAASAFGAGCATTPPQGAPSTLDQARAGQEGTDDILAREIYSALKAEPMYYFCHVDVRVDNGVANLSGYVWDTDELYRARTIASRTPGVTRVVTNQLELERNGRSGGSGPSR